MVHFWGLYRTLGPFQRVKATIWLIFGGPGLILVHFSAWNWPIWPSFGQIVRSKPGFGPFLGVFTRFQSHFKESRPAFSSGGPGLDVAHLWACIWPISGGSGLVLGQFWGHAWIWPISGGMGLELAHFWESWHGFGPHILWTYDEIQIHHLFALHMDLIYDEGGQS